MASTTQDGHENETKEKCPICLTTDLIDPSIPGGCGNDPGHKFCYTCLRTEPLVELKEQFLKEKMKEESEKIPLDMEKQLLHKYCRDLNTRLNKLNEQMDRNGKGQKRKSQKDASQFSDYERHRRKLVQAINMIKSLQQACENQTIDRLTLNQNPCYRRMIYHMHLQREDVSTNEMRRNFGPKMAKEELKGDSSRLHNWLRKEIPILLNVSPDQIHDLEEKVDSVLMAVQEGHIHAPEFEAICGRIFREARDHLSLFCNEFFDFASSQYSMEMFFQNSRYKAAEANRNEGQARPVEVIHLDDYVPIDNDVQIVGSSHHSNEFLDYLARQQRQQRQRIQSGHTDSEEEEGADIYMHPACRITSKQPSASTRHRQHNPRIITRGASAIDHQGIPLNTNWPPNIATQNLLRASVPAVRASTPGEEIVLSSNDEGRLRAFDIVAGRNDERPSRSLESSIHQMPTKASCVQKNRKLRKRVHSGPSQITYQEEDSESCPIPSEDVPTADEILPNREKRWRNRSTSYSWSPSDRVLKVVTDAMKAQIEALGKQLEEKCGEISSLRVICEQVEATTRGQALQLEQLKLMEEKNSVLKAQMEALETQLKEKSGEISSHYEQVEETTRQQASQLEQLKLMEEAIPALGETNEKPKRGPGRPLKAKRGRPPGISQKAA